MEIVIDITEKISGFGERKTRKRIIITRRREMVAISEISFEAAVELLWL